MKSATLSVTHVGSVLVALYATNSVPFETI